MKTNLSLAVVVALTLAAECGAPIRAAEPDSDGVALAIVYDTSGSMKETVRDKNGRATAKFLIANRALTGIARQIETYTTSHEARSVHTTLLIFENDRIKTAIPLRKFQRDVLEKWAQEFREPQGGTPLGEAIRTATKLLTSSPAPRKHILVVTDGMNTVGPAPAPVIAQLQKSAETAQTPVGIHFIAFDIDARLFNPLRKLGVTVVGAADEPQLNTQLEFILAKKILLEDEEPAHPTPKHQE